MKMREKNVFVNGFFIRKSRKKSGLLKMIEGKLTNEPIILVDDLINQGYTLSRQLKVLEKEGKRVDSFFTVLRFRELDAYKEYLQKGISMHTVFTLDDFSENLGLKILLAPTESKILPQEKFSSQWYFKSEFANFKEVRPKSGLVIDSKNIYVGSDQGTVWAIDQEDGKIIWKFPIGRQVKKAKIYAAPILYSEKIYFGTHEGDIVCLDTCRRW